MQKIKEATFNFFDQLVRANICNSIGFIAALLLELFIYLDTLKETLKAGKGDGPEGWYSYLDYLNVFTIAIIWIANFFDEHGCRKVICYRRIFRVLSVTFATLFHSLLCSLEF